MNKGLMFVVSGPSGAGKGTICKQIGKKLNIELSVSMTTREPRPGEVEGESYYFVGRDSFMKVLDDGGFLEHACVYGNYYGTPKEKVVSSLKKGLDVVLEIDIQGALQVRNSYPKAIFIFILPPSMGELRKRITGRGSESEEAINIRMAEALKEVSYIDKYNYCIVNDDLDEAVERVAAVIKAEHSRVSENIYELIEGYFNDL